MTNQHKANIARGLKLARSRRRRSVAMIEAWKRRRNRSAQTVRSNHNEPITLDWLKQQALDSAATETQAILDGQPASITEFWRGQKNAYTNLYNKLTNETH